MLVEKHRGRDSYSSEGANASNDAVPPGESAGGGCRLNLILSVALSITLLVLVWCSGVLKRSSSNIEVFSASYFFCCFLGGVLSGLPHTLMTPLDLIKCRMQVGEYESMREGFRKVCSEADGSPLNCIPLFFRGWVPTFIGYSAQGGLKFLFYEFFKFLFLRGHGDAHQNLSPAYCLVMYLAASFLAEMIADIALAPWEAVKIKIQTTNLHRPYLSNVLHMVWTAEGCRGFYKGLPALWCRQVPYTVVKFVAFENISNLLYHSLGSVPRSTTSKATQLFISLLSGVLAGILCAIVSHPADTVVSKLNQRVDGSHNTKNTAFRHLRELGWSGIWKGLGARLFMVGSLTAIQWLLYDSFKVFMGLPTTGGSGSVQRNSLTPHIGISKQ